MKLEATYNILSRAGVSKIMAHRLNPAHGVFVQAAVGPLVPPGQGTVWPVAHPVVGLGQLCSWTAAFLGSLGSRGSFQATTAAGPSPVVLAGPCVQP